MARQPRATLEQLRERLAKVQEQIAKEEEKRRTAALEEIHSLMVQHGLTPTDIAGKGKRGPAKKQSKAASKTTVAPKYQDPKTGVTWSGRGREPLWIKGKKREKFLVAE
jgi:DNA-binding protein H-NS